MLHSFTSPTSEEFEVQKEEEEKLDLLKQRLKDFHQKVENHIKKLLKGKDPSLRYPPMTKSFRDIMFVF
jgi:hypothetical protein